MKFVVGLGNPGSRYAGTKHNVGFDVVDQLLGKHQLTFTDQKFTADFTIWHRSAERVLLAQPFTYMNLSGQAILPLMSYFGVHLDDLLVVYDDLDLSPGKIRLKQKGSAGGHNGLKNIIELLGSQEFKRLKIGIGRPEPGWKVADHVLAPFKTDQRQVIDQAIDQGVEIIEHWLDGTDFKQLMNDYN